MQCRERAQFQPLLLSSNQNRSLTIVTIMPVGGDEFLSHSYSDENSVSAQKGVACGTGDSHQPDFECGLQ